METRPTC